MLLFDFIVLRTPTQSLISAFEVHSGLQPIFLEGLYLASHDFYHQFKKFEFLSKAEKLKVIQSLLKYRLRASTRCTPFGTFAGTAFVTLTEKNNDIVLNEPKQHDRKVRLDMGYIYFLISELEKWQIIEDQIQLFPNNSVYITPIDLRYTELVTSNFANDYKLSAVEQSDYLSVVLNAAINGSTINELSKLLSDFAKVGIDDARQFIVEVWHSNLLVSNLEPCVTGREPFEELLFLIGKYKGTKSLNNQLREIENRLKSPFEGAEYYIETEKLIKNMFPIPEHIKNLMQTDLFLSCKDNEINKNVIESVIMQVEDLMSIARTPANSELDNFRKKFLEKYENKTVPLTLAIDADLGIGYAGTYDDMGAGHLLIDDIAAVSVEVPRVEYDDLQNYVFNKYVEYIQSGKECIEISADDIAFFKTKAKQFKFPVSMYCSGSLMKKGGKLDKENFVFELSGAGGPSAANLLGRFTQGNEKLLTKVRKILSKEEQESPEIIFAEIVHLPQARTGNVLLRPLLRKYEIPYVGKSGAPTNNQILIDDLYLCVRNDEIILLSKKHNKRVMPRLSTAHNYMSNSLPLYKFLCDLQSQKGAYGAVWDWGRLDNLKVLPRVNYKDIIVKKAQWKVELKDIVELPSSSETYIEFFKEFRTKNKMPDRVLLVQSDNKILIDFCIKESILMFLGFLKKHKVTVLQEFLFTETNCIVKDTFGLPYTNEIIIPIHNVVNENQRVQNYQFNEYKFDKKFHPGSEWLYFKLFCSVKTADKFLTQHFLPFVNAGKKKKLFSSFFFIRYKENGSHLRIRFHNSKISNQSKLTKKFVELLEPLLDSNVIHKINIDSYVQETERYGGPALITMAEALFATDSEATLKILDLLEPNNEDNFRIFFAMRSIDLLMNDFRIDLSAKKNLLKTLSDQFLEEFGGSHFLQKSINSKYKKLKQSIFSYMDFEQDSKNDFRDVMEIFDERSMRNKEIVDKIYVEIPEQERVVKISELLRSFIHMSVNRMFMSYQRKYELLIYNFLERYYTSIIFINSKK